MDKFVLKSDFFVLKKTGYVDKFVPKNVNMWTNLYRKATEINFCHILAKNLNYSKMGEIRSEIKASNLDGITKEIGHILIDFYHNMKDLEKDVNRGGKQAVLIVMTLNDIEQLFKQHNKK